MEQVDSDILEEEQLQSAERREQEATLLIRHLVAHADYQAALLFTQGQYLLYQRRGGTVVCKGVSAQTVRTAFVGEPVDSGWLPEGIVRWGSGGDGTFLVKYIPPGKHELRLSTSSTTLESITPPLPGLIFAGVNRTYYVWALRERSYAPDSSLFHAPFPNVYPDGHICFGSNQPPIADWETLDVAWHLFLTAPFNSDMAHGKSQAFAQDVRQRLVALSKSNARRYPVQDLTPYIGGRPYMMRSREICTLDDAVEYYLLKKGDDE